MEKQIYTFLGLPAAGKGTQAQIFADKHGYDQIGIGDLVREEIKNGDHSDPETKAMIEKYNKGLPVDDSSVFKLIAKKLAGFKNSDKSGILLDNFPFTQPQADFISKYIEDNKLSKLILVNIKISPDSAVKRITIRKICPKCKGIFAGEIDICPNCEEKLIARADDNEEVVRKRIEKYKPQIDEMVEYFQEKGKVIEIDGEKSVPEVTDEINAKL